MDTAPPVRFVRVVDSIPVGADSILTVEDPDDPAWPGETLGAPGRIERGSEGYLRFVPGRSYPPRRPDGWAFRRAGGTVETGRPGAGTPGPDGAGPAGEPEGEHPDA